MTDSKLGDLWDGNVSFHAENDQSVEIHVVVCSRLTDIDHTFTMQVHSGVITNVILMRIVTNSLTC